MHLFLKHRTLHSPISSSSSFWLVNITWTHTPQSCNCSHIILRMHFQQYMFFWFLVFCIYHSYFPLKNLPFSDIVLGIHTIVFCGVNVHSLSYEFVRTCSKLQSDVLREAIGQVVDLLVMPKRITASSQRPLSSKLVWRITIHRRTNVSVVLSSDLIFLGLKWKSACLGMPSMLKR